MEEIQPHIVKIKIKARNAWKIGSKLNFYKLEEVKGVHVFFSKDAGPQPPHDVRNIK